MQKQFFVYILASKRHGTIYIGVTSNLIRRTFQHKQSQHPGFTQKHKVNKLVYFEVFSDPNSAITREKQLKKWKRQWKILLIEQSNPEWIDLYDGLV